jgi:hypothetical protein
MKDKLETGMYVVALLAFLYVAAYFAMVRRGPTFQLSGQWVASPRYVALPQPAQVCFGQLHEWDRSLFRPGFWAGTIPPEQLRKQQLLAAEVLLKEVQPAAPEK